MSQHAGTTQWIQEQESMGQVLPYTVKNQLNAYMGWVNGQLTQFKISSYLVYTSTEVHVVYGLIHLASEASVAIAQDCYREKHTNDENEPQCIYEYSDSTWLLPNLWPMIQGFMTACEVKSGQSACEKSQSVWLNQDLKQACMSPVC